MSKEALNCRPFSRILIAATFALSLAASPVGAATMPADADLASQAGAAVNQRFLPGGASIVTTAEHRSCVVSRRIDIETSVYRDPDGQAVAFAEIRRSPAASVQAVAAESGPPGFRLQLKYSPRAGTPILLTADGNSIDLQAMLEPSTDSLWIDGAAAVALDAAFRAGERPVLEATSRDTGRRVTDRLETPDLAALTRCQAALPDEPAAGPLTNAVRVVFHADARTTPLATLPDLRACGMTDAPGRLHLARLEMVTGFFAQTDKVFVSFDAAGELEQVYVPGIFDGDFRDGGRRVRLSRAADGNVPMAENAVEGCLGTGTIEVCHYTTAGGGHLLAGCPDFGTPVAGLAPPSGGPDRSLALTSLLPNQPGGGSGYPSGGLLPGGGSGGGPGGGDGPGDDNNGPGGGNGPDDDDGPGDDDNGPDDDAPAPIPLPASVLLLLTAVLGLHGLRRRQA